MPAICVYCGSNFGKDPIFLEKALRLGKILAQKKQTLIYGGGNVGLMGALADEVLAAGGKVIGVIPEALAAQEVAHDKLTELHVVSSMHERKQLMASLADGFLALPGGIGTLEEIMEVFVWTQLGVHPKPCALLNVNRFYEPLITLLSGMVANGFLHPEQFSQLLVSEDPQQVVELLLSTKPTLIDKWLDGKKPMPKKRQ
ncbi:MAG: TIGR00730 family Rossman fold protein [Chthoniobacterales bacterium]|nr:TIGR00730 family Rossman fold protein [Chthoniobacterales bacterium]